MDDICSLTDWLKQKEPKEPKESKEQKEYLQTGLDEKAQVHIRNGLGKNKQLYPQTGRGKKPQVLFQVGLHEDKLPQIQENIYPHSPLSFVPAADEPPSSGHEQSFQNEELPGSNSSIALPKVPRHTSWAEEEELPEGNSLIALPAVPRHTSWAGEEELPGGNSSFALPAVPRHTSWAEKEELGWRIRKRFMLFRLTVAALIFLFFALGLRYDLFPSWMSEKKIHKVLSENALSERLEEWVGTICP